ncbi:hypothetical protein QVN91_13285, partial [Bacteroides caecigallinarum]|nr:hypothetical protein [Bacteroides caecigallinarum]
LKSFKELSFVLEAKAFAKVRDLFLTTKLFRKFFFEKVFSGLKTRLSFSLPCYYKVRYSKGFSYLLTQLQHVNLIALPLESGCKDTDFFHSCNSLNDFFFKKSITFDVIYCKSK